MPSPTSFAPSPERNPHNPAILRQSPETATLRDTLARLLAMVRRYDGSTNAEEELFDALLAFEQTHIVKRPPSSGVEYEHLSPQERLTHEIEIVRAAHPTSPSIRIINDILGLAGKRVDQLISQRLEDEEDSTFDLEGEDNVHIVHIHQVLLPPSNGTNPIQENGSREFKPPRFQERLSELMSLLRERGVGTNDLLILLGKRDPRMMRKRAYALVQIPRLDVSILVCNQVGEATFVLPTMISTTEATTWTKEDLEQEFPDTTTRIIYRSSDQWKQEITEILFGANKKKNAPEPTQPSEKIDLKKLETKERVRDSLVAMFPEPVSFLRLAFDKFDKLNLVINERSLSVYQIARAFSIQRTHSTRLSSMRFDIAKILYGTRHPTITAWEEISTKRLDPAAVIEAVKKILPTSQDYFKQSNNQLGALGVLKDPSGDKMGIVSIFHLLVQRRCVFFSDRENVFTLAEHIYGADDAGVQDYRNLERHIHDPDVLRAYVREHYPDPWSLYRTLMERESHITITVGSAQSTFGVRAFTSLFGLHTALSLSRARLFICEAIYEAEHPGVRDIRDTLETRESPTRLRKLVQEQYQDATSLIRNSVTDWNRLFADGGDGQGITLLTVHGILAQRHQSFSANVENRLAIAISVFGEQDPIIKQWTDCFARRNNPAEIMQEIRSAFPTRTSFLAISLKELRTITFLKDPSGEGVSMVTLIKTLTDATMKNITEPYRQTFAEWFYRDASVVENEIRQRRAQEEEELRKKIDTSKNAFLRTFPDAYSFLSATRETIKTAQLSIPGEEGISIHTLSHLLTQDVSLNPKNKFEDRLILSEHVFGMHDPINQAWRAALETQRDPEKLRKLLLAIYPTARSLVDIDTHIKIAHFAPTPDGHGIGIVSVANVFGILQFNLTSKEDRVHLASALHGDVPFIHHWKQYLEMCNSPSLLRAHLTQHYKDAFTFLSIPAKKKDLFSDPSGDSVGWVALASLFGLNQFSAGTFEDRFSLAERIYGTDDPTIIRWNEVLDTRSDPERLYEEVRLRIPTKEQFLTYAPKEIRKIPFAVDPNGDFITLIGIATAINHPELKGLTKADISTLADLIYG